MDTHLHIPFSGPLKEYVVAIWQVRGNSFGKETILPKGIVEIIFNYTPQTKGSFTNELIIAPRCFIQGLNTHCLKVEYTGHQNMLGVQMHRDKVKDVLGVLPGEFNNRLVDLELINPHFGMLWHRLAELNSFEERVVVLENSLPLISDQYCERTTHLAQLFQGGSVERFQSVDTLAREVCYSTRQLGRISQQLFGLSPEELISYKKFLQSVQLISHQNKSLTSIAYEAGYYDQAHFCRSFKSYAGMTAMQYKKQKSHLPFHIFS